MVEHFSDDSFLYHVSIQDISFDCRMTLDSLQKSADYALDILEELKNINNEGYDKQMLAASEEKYDKKYGKDADSFISILIYGDFASRRLTEILNNLDELRHVGGTYALLLSNPSMKSAICAVFERIIGEFDNEKLYQQSAYFLLRSIMHIQCTEN